MSAYNMSTSLNTTRTYLKLRRCIKAFGTASVGGLLLLTPTHTLERAAVGHESRQAGGEVCQSALIWIELMKDALYLLRKELMPNASMPTDPRPSLPPHEKSLLKGLCIAARGHWAHVSRPVEDVIIAFENVNHFLYEMLFSQTNAKRLESSLWSVSFMGCFQWAQINLSNICTSLDDRAALQSAELLRSEESSSAAGRGRTKKEKKRGTHSAPLLLTYHTTQSQSHNALDDNGLSRESPSVQPGSEEVVSEEEMDTADTGSPFSGYFTCVGGRLIAMPMREEEESSKKVSKKMPEDHQSAKGIMSDGNELEAKSASPDQNSEKAAEEKDDIPFTVVASAGHRRSLKKTSDRHKNISATNHTPANPQQQNPSSPSLSHHAPSSVPSSPRGPKTHKPSTQTHRSKHHPSYPSSVTSSPSSPSVSSRPVNKFTFEEEALAIHWGPKAQAQPQTVSSDGSCNLYSGTSVKSPVPVPPSTSSQPVPPSTNPSPTPAHPSPSTPSLPHLSCLSESCIGTTASSAVLIPPVPVPVPGHVAPYLPPASIGFSSPYANTVNPPPSVQRKPFPYFPFGFQPSPPPLHLPYAYLPGASSPSPKESNMCKGGNQYQSVYSDGKEITGHVHAVSTSVSVDSPASPLLTLRPRPYCPNPTPYPNPPAYPEQIRESTPVFMQCGMCLQAPANVLLISCAHISLCVPCSSKAMACPKCSAPFSTTVTVYPA
mmetsp:Transcript_35716/g.57770  ORF Transcript_35716/g.57770 Transcript_35716/m.57770 type:complete len:716 (-) Transcript_35716:1661-3808(-)